MSVTNLVRHTGNNLYKFAFPLYRPLYRMFKMRADRAERRLLLRDVPPGSIAVDAGANIGIYSEFLSHCVGLTGFVHSFEPDPLNFRRLQAALDQHSNVRLNELALSDRTGESALYVSHNLNVDHRAYPTANESRKIVAIRSIRLDDYFPAGTRVDFIKMDIQGFELHALRGAKRVLGDNPAVKLLIEFWPYGLRLAGSSIESLASFLSDRDLKAFVLGPRELIEYDVSLVTSHDPSNYTNLLIQKA